VRLIFAGTPEFAHIALERLHAAGFDIGLVLTQPDRPAGRGMKLQSSPVKHFALEHGIEVAQPRSLRLDGKYSGDAQAAKRAINTANADAMVVAAYGLILPQWVLDAPRSGCLNIHASLLPRWRGAAPIQRAIEAGDAQTGVTIMQMDAGLDTGDMLLAQRVPIAATDTTGSLQEKLAQLGGRLIVQALELAVSGELHAVPQPQDGMTYAHKIERAEAAVDWSQPAAIIARRIRAFDPFPGAQGVVNGETLKLWRAEALPQVPGERVPGRVLSVSPHGIDVQCGEGRLRVTELQRPGGKRLGVADFLRGFDLKPGTSFDPPHRS
jgi:methionyl-tRNA formyltransferase